MYVSELLYMFLKKYWVIVNETHVLLKETKHLNSMNRKYMIKSMGDSNRAQATLTLHCNLHYTLLAIPLEAHNEADDV